MLKHTYEAVVIGAGPAGSTCAKILARNKIDVLLLEKKREVGSPPHCAGYVPKLLNFYVSIDKHCVAQQIKKMRTYFPSGKIYETNVSSYIVNRDLFDKFLASEAIRNGAKLSIETTVTELLKENNKIEGVIASQKGEKLEIKSNIVIAADGSSSNIARLAGLNIIKPNELVFCAQFEMANVDLDPSLTEFYFSTQFAPGGYGWIFPKGKDVANVGLCIKQFFPKPLEHLNKFIEKHPIASKKLVKASPIGFYTGMLPIRGPIEKTHANQLLVVGDAAGHTDPVSGAGISSAIICGKIAGEVATKAIKAGDTSENFLREYEILWKKILGKRLLRSVNKRRQIDEAWSSDQKLEEILPKVWIAFESYYKED